MLSTSNIKSLMIDILLLYPLHAFLIIGLLLIVLWVFLDVLSISKQSPEKY